MSSELETLIRGRSATVSVIGLGYVGLPLVKAFYGAGFPLVGFDVDEKKIEMLQAGRSYIDSVGSSLVADMISSDRFKVTCDFQKLREVDVIVICVPTPLSSAREPDLSHVRRTSEAIAANLRPGQLVVLESTTYPGTTDEVVQPILESSGLVAGTDFYLAFSPEREDPGNQRFSTKTIPKLVGGTDAESGHLAACLYRAAVDTVVEVSHARVAEAAKILENVYRAVNIALVNELKVLFDRMNIDVWEVIRAASTKPFGFQAFYPGPGLGGHCIPIDPFYLASKAREYGLTTRFIELAGEINSAMPQYVVHKVAETLNSHRKSVNGSRGLILGVAYKKNTDDVRESPAFAVMELLRDLGASLVFFDPYVERLPKMRHYDVEADRVALNPQTLSDRDFTLIITDHDDIDWDLVVEHSRLVIDTRNATRDVREGREKIFMA